MKSLSIFGLFFFGALWYFQTASSPVVAALFSDNTELPVVRVTRTICLSNCT